MKGKSHVRFYLTRLQLRLFQSTPPAIDTADIFTESALTIASVAELADALDLGSSGETRGGSSPPSRTFVNTEFATKLQFHPSERFSAWSTSQRSRIWSETLSYFAHSCNKYTCPTCLFCTVHCVSGAPSSISDSMRSRSAGRSSPSGVLPIRSDVRLHPARATHG